MNLISKIHCLPNSFCFKLHFSWRTIDPLPQPSALRIMRFVIQIVCIFQVLSLWEQSARHEIPSTKPCQCCSTSYTKGHSIKQNFDYQAVLHQRVHCTVELGNPHSGSSGRIRSSAQRGLLMLQNEFENVELTHGTRLGTDGKALE